MSNKRDWNDEILEMSDDEILNMIGRSVDEAERSETYSEGKILDTVSMLRES